MLSLSSRLFRGFSAFSLLALLSGLAACGVAVTSETFGKLYHDELCNQLENCCKGKTIGDGGKAFFGASVQECMSLYEKDRSLGGITINFKKTVDGLLKNPNIAFNAASATSCLAGIKSASCGSSSFSAPPASCRETFQGKLTEGATCTGSECAPGHVCTFSEGALVCKKTVADGEACSASIPCNPSTSFCDFADPKCKPFKAKGEDCTSAQCGFGLNCGATKKCEEPGLESICK